MTNENEKSLMLLAQKGKGKRNQGRETDKTNEYDECRNGGVGM